MTPSAAAEASRLLAEVEAQDAELVSIIVTHSHIDHVAAVAAVKAKTGVPVIAHRAASLGRLDPISAQFLPMLGGEPPPPADQLVDDGDEIPVGDQSLRVVHVPGHTPGDIALYHPGAVFTGDCLFVNAADSGFVPVPCAHLVGAGVGVVAATHVLPAFHGWTWAAAKPT